MTIEQIKKFASDACLVIDACQGVIAEQDAELRKMASEKSKLEEIKKTLLKTKEETDKAEAEEKKKEAEELAVTGIDADKLSKAASAVYELYGSPSNVSAQAIADAWKAKPALMVNVINKFANELMTRASVSGVGLGEPISKQASSDEGQDADSIFWSHYKF